MATPSFYPPPVHAHGSTNEIGNRYKPAPSQPRNTRTLLTHLLSPTPLSRAPPFSITPGARTAGGSKNVHETKRARSRTSPHFCLRTVDGRPSTAVKRSTGLNVDDDDDVCVQLPGPTSAAPHLCPNYECLPSLPSSPRASLCARKINQNLRYSSIADDANINS